jgi:hypothetical protein
MEKKNEHKYYEKKQAYFRAEDNYRSHIASSITAEIHA